MRFRYNPHRNRRSDLAPELLESRLNLSALGSALAPPAATALQPIQIVGLPSTQSVKPISLPLAGATALASQTTIPIASYSAIANSQIELQPGQTQQDIGYVAPTGAYVDYTVTAPAAGTYSVTLGLASYSGANVQILVNSAAQTTIQASATKAWATYTAASANIQLAAGSNVIRLASQNGTQYNLNNVTFAPLSATTLPAVNPVTPVSDNSSVPITSFSAISNSRLEYQSGIPDIGYVASNGAYVDYTLNVATAGNYTLTAATAGISPTTFSVSINGNQIAAFSAPTTGSWQTFATTSQTVSLAAGQQTLRFTATNSSQYNLRTIQLVRQAAPPPPPPPVSPPPPPASPPSPFAATITQRWMTSFNEIDVVAASGSDSIMVTQSGNTLTITANGQSQQLAANGELAIWAGNGHDTITVGPSVTLDTRLYGGNGSDTLTNLTRGQATIVAIGGGNDTLTGNGINTSYWADSVDNVIASPAEQAIGGVHVVTSFFQNAATGPVPLQLNGQNLTDPAAAVGGTTRLTSSSFFGLGPVQQDINQGGANDCYFLTALQSLARVQPGDLRQMAVDLGDGTYAIEFQRNGQVQYVRVDGELPVNSAGNLYYNHPGATGDQWASIFEKAYAVFRTGQNTYASLDFGFPTVAYNDLGIAASTIAMPTDPNAFYALATSSLASGKAVDICTNITLSGNVPLIADHTYSVVNAWRDTSGVVWVTVRNPWGYDGFSVDSNPGDGMISMTYAALQANSIFGTVMT